MCVCVYINIQYSIHSLCLSLSLHFTKRQTDRNPNCTLSLSVSYASPYIPLCLALTLNSPLSPTGRMPYNPIFPPNFNLALRVTREEASLCISSKDPNPNL